MDDEAKVGLMKVHSRLREEGGGGRWAGGQVCVAAADRTRATKTRRGSGRTLATSFTLRKEESCYS